MPAIIAAGIGIAALALIGNVETTWSFSAFTVLIYYAITNLAALRLPQENRLYPRAVAWCGLLACLSLAFFVEREIWVVGIGLVDRRAEFREVLPACVLRNPLDIARGGVHFRDLAARFPLAGTAHAKKFFFSHPYAPKGSG